MSASQDRSQKVAFLYTNLYQLYRNEKSETQSQKSQGKPGLKQAFIKSKLDRISMISFSTEAVKRATVYSRIIKAKRLQSRGLEVSKPQLIAKSEIRPVKIVREVKSLSERTIEDLRRHVSSLDKLHKRLRFMLKELGEMTGDEK